MTATGGIMLPLPIKLVWKFFPYISLLIGIGLLVMVFWKPTTFAKAEMNTPKFWKKAALYGIPLYIGIVLIIFRWRKKIGTGAKAMGRATTNMGRRMGQQIGRSSQQMGQQMRNQFNRSSQMNIPMQSMNIPIQQPMYAQPQQMYQSQMQQPIYQPQMLQPMYQPQMQPWMQQIRQMSPFG